MGLLDGLAVALQPTNLVLVFFGVFVGMVIGVLPGLGPTATMSLLLPLTFSMGPESAIIMLAGIYYGSMYGGTITSVLLRLPGEAASIVTTFDGYQMARQGRAGPALGIAAVGSFLGGTVSVIGLTLLSGLLAKVALAVGPPEFAALTVLGMAMVAFLGTKSFTKSLVMVGIGLLIAAVGQDPITGQARLTFGFGELLDGVDLVAVAMGLFGIGEMLHNLEHQTTTPTSLPSVSRVWPTRRDWRQARGSVVRGGVIGFLIGTVPGGGGVVSSLVSYAVEKRRAKQPERFGKGAIEGVAGPETANNASSTAAFIPLLTLGLPSNVVMAVIFGALLIHDITPGPQLISEHPQVFWGVIASMYVGNLMLLVLNVPLVGMFIRLLSLRFTLLAPLTVTVIMLGVYTINSSTFDVWVALVCGIIGYLMRKTGFDPGPLVLALALGAILERSFRQSLLISNGSLAIFVTRPGSAVILVFATLLLFSPLIGNLWRRSRKQSDPPALTGLPEAIPRAREKAAGSSGSGVDD
ncbi:tripartite tricarboxylate transporter permease [Actinomadura soli]|uniref:Tripartite tricarboxylate transporter permease n=1 Tax=Actinomadura soli TaxID=2508997 RepID=A0A5C4JJ28_9ACTN|nr:tripartite tricarboxylate transporter permease [Actinomadura soli]TMR06926.1 tripartite tricarboxylate transporter permease [Actinomadura soli]